jgi:hypothetical protein
LSAGSVDNGGWVLDDTEGGDGGDGDGGGGSEFGYLNAVSD